MKRALWLLAAGTVLSGVFAWGAVGRPAPSAPVKPPVPNASKPTP